MSNNHLLERIVTNLEIQGGRPIIKGTRVTVEIVLKYLAQNPDVNDLFVAYPHLTPDDVRACLEYAQRHVESEDVHPVFATPSSV